MFAVMAIALASALPAKAANEIAGRFNGWLVVKSVETKKMVALMEDAPQPRLAASCSNSMGVYLLTLKVPVFRDARRNRNLEISQMQFRAWADDQPSFEFLAPVRPELPTSAEVWVSLNPNIHEWPERLWKIFKGARVRFSYSTTSGVETFDARDLPAASALFEQLCVDIIPK
jgi:hypothetical protein